MVRPTAHARRLPRRPARPVAADRPLLGLAFVPITILAETGVQDREYGLASGLVNASQQIGGALCLAVLITIATSPTNHLIAGSHTFGQALTLRFHLGLLGAAAFVLLAIIAAATIGTRRTNRSQLPPPARQPEPQTCFDRLDQPRSASSLRGWSRSATFASDTKRAAHPHAASNSLTTGSPDRAVADPAGIDEYS